MGRKLLMLAYEAAWVALIVGVFAGFPLWMFADLGVVIASGMAIHIWLMVEDLRRGAARCAACGLRGCELCDPHQDADRG